MPPERGELFGNVVFPSSFVGLLNSFQQKQSNYLMIGLVVSENAAAATPPPPLTPLPFDSPNIINFNNMIFL
jgi:hypothetical protein